MNFSTRLDKLAPYPFVEISRIIAEKRAAGADVVTFGIGDPDIPTPQPIIERLLAASQDPPNHSILKLMDSRNYEELLLIGTKNVSTLKLDPDTEVLP
ncbi:MAG: hypothetical protein Ct9H300mP27_11180 [Chloroflexota bacterium]|nr:MAG: hypothetical protein Ct9H300mP27_11180 [Chloroflexota bacterium]